MSINIRQKGAEGERQVAKILNSIIQSVMEQLEYPEEEIEAAKTAVQRNQNQSAVGGNDLSNTFGMSIEVKRQEQLAVNTWWKQTLEAANRNNELPVLIYRQNRKPWRIRTFAYLHVPSEAVSGGWANTQAVVEFDEKQFKSWFAMWVRGSLLGGKDVRT